jgi:hypothetical protein
LTVAVIRSFRGDTPWRSETEAPRRELKGTCNLYRCHGTTPSILYIGAGYRHPVPRAGSHRCPCQRALITSPALASEYFSRDPETRKEKKRVQYRRKEICSTVSELVHLQPGLLSLSLLLTHSPRISLRPLDIIILLGYLRSPFLSHIYPAFFSSSPHIASGSFNLVACYRSCFCF